MTAYKNNPIPGVGYTCDDIWHYTSDKLCRDQHRIFSHLSKCLKMNLHAEACKNAAAVCKSMLECGKTTSGGAVALYVITALIIMLDICLIVIATGVKCLGESGWCIDYKHNFASLNHTDQEHIKTLFNLKVIPSDTALFSVIIVLESILLATCKKNNALVNSLVDTDTLIYLQADDKLQDSHDAKLSDEPVKTNDKTSFNGFTLFDHRNVSDFNVAFRLKYDTMIEAIKRCRIK